VHLYRHFNMFLPSCLQYYDLKKEIDCRWLFWKISIKQQTQSSSWP
jgi:hypothetical protein